MLETDAAIDLPKEIASQLKNMNVMEMMAFNHACLIGWRSAWRFIQQLSIPMAVAPARREEFADDPRVQDWDRQIEDNRKRVEAEAAKQAAKPTPP